MTSYRTKYKSIISEVFLPKKHNGTTVIFLAGLPSYLGKNKITEALIANGCVVFQPFWSGSYDSDGVFSPANCLKDVTDYVRMAKQKSITELYYQKIFRIQTRKIILIGTSFGGSIAALAADNSINKLILLSPVLAYEQKTINRFCPDFDFSSQMRALLVLVQKGYPHTYRIKSLAAWKEFLLPPDDGLRIVNQLQRANMPILIVHGKNDSAVPYVLTVELLKEREPKEHILITPDCGHSLSSYDNDIIGRIVKFACQNHR